MSNDETTARIQEALKAKGIDQEIACAQALALAEELGVSPMTVGQTCNALAIKIRHCQLGCFGHKTS